MLLENITALCRKRNISIARLEREVGLGNATVRGWKESSPSADNLKKVADYFGVSMDSLVRGNASESTRS